jgi:hypothetical protein
MNIWEMVKRDEKVARIIIALDKHLGHTASCEEALLLSENQWKAILKDAKAAGDRKPSGETIRLLADQLRLRDESARNRELLAYGKGGKDPFEGF